MQVRNVCLQDLTDAAIQSAPVKQVFLCKYPYCMLYSFLYIRSLRIEVVFCEITDSDSIAGFSIVQVDENCNKREKENGSLWFVLQI